MRAELACDFLKHERAGTKVAKRLPEREKLEITHVTGNKI